MADVRVAVLLRMWDVEALAAAALDKLLLSLGGPGPVWVRGWVRVCVRCVWFLV